MKKLVEIILTLSGGIGLTLFLFTGKQAIGAELIVGVAICAFLYGMTEVVTEDMEKLMTPESKKIRSDRIKRIERDEKLNTLLK